MIYPNLTLVQTTSFYLNRVTVKLLSSQWLRPIRTGLLDGDLSSPCHKGNHWIHCQVLCGLHDLLCSDLLQILQQATSHESHSLIYQRTCSKNQVTDICIPPGNMAFFIYYITVFPNRNWSHYCMKYGQWLLNLVLTTSLSMHCYKRIRDVNRVPGPGKTTRTRVSNYPKISKGQ